METFNAFEHFRRISQLKSIHGLLAWDSEVYLPQSSIAIRHAQISALTAEIHKLSCAPEFIQSVMSLSSHINGIEEHQIRNLKTFCLRQAAINPHSKQKIINKELEAVEKWKVAKENSDFSQIAGLLRELIDLRKEVAEQVACAVHLRDKFNGASLYDVMIDASEPGLKNRDLESLFIPLKAGLLERLRHNQPATPNRKILLVKPEKLSMHELIKQFGFDFAKGRLDITQSYPFCGGSPGDVRITTQSNGDFVDNLLTTLHELGHGLYEQNIPSHLHFTPSGQGASTGFHESQSRFYENQIGRSDAFIKYISKKIDIPFPELLPHFRDLKSSAIRTTADELHYNLHIILRWELERDLIDGTLKVSDLPEAWNSKMMEYFNIHVRNNAEGCLQDLHWFMSDFAWFPTYTLGNLIAAQLFKLFVLKHPNWEERVENGDFLFIKEFLGRLHKLGSMYEFKETSKIIFEGALLSEKPLLDYLDNRYIPAISGE